MLMHELPHCLLNFHFFSQHCMFLFSKTFFYCILYCSEPFWDALFLFYAFLARAFIQLTFQERMTAHIKLLCSRINKGKVPKEMSAAVSELKDLAAFHQNVSVAMGTAL